MAKPRQLNSKQKYARLEKQNERKQAERERLATKRMRYLAAPVSVSPKEAQG